MTVVCTSPLTANPGSIAIPGNAQLSISVTASNDVVLIDVEYVILDQTVGVQFASGGTVDQIQVIATSANMTITHNAQFICRTGNQFLAFDVEARIRQNGVLQCVPVPTVRIGSPIFNCAATLKALPGKEHLVHDAVADALVVEAIPAEAPAKKHSKKKHKGPKNPEPSN